MAKGERIARAAALRAAGKRLPILPEKTLARNLDMMGASLAEAYRAGAEEAQGEIVARLVAIPAAGAKGARA